MSNAGGGGGGRVVVSSPNGNNRGGRNPNPWRDSTAAPSVSKRFRVGRIFAAENLDFGTLEEALRNAAIEATASAQRATAIAQQAAAAAADASRDAAALTTLVDQVVAWQRRIVGQREQVRTCS